ncbi:thiamine diphosphokinase [Stygiobacter electus]|uniref:Thiamine diphosphokinase n=1 Tax=Stygiobacter electus TaxID=3032292 RepID=A0AAE3P171_9BACT|nr:thiamine diphosphokinase [Stygiobacter electus]MDF1612507.1 thiamine diphosphokinase [Stygiobacter electus]
MKKCIIIANGDLPKKNVVKYFFKKNYNTIICADGGANSAMKIGVIPNFIIGDFDSINESTKNYFKGKSKFINIKRQNDTDVEKSLKFAFINNFDEVILLGATGDRLDHTICNLGIVLKYFNQIKIKIVHQKSFLIPLSGKVKLNTEIGETISLYAFNERTSITSFGLKYKLNKTKLPFGKKESTSNVAVKNEIKLNIENGIIFLIRDFDLARKNDFI